METAVKIKTVCFKCGGSIVTEPGIDGDDTVEKCLACGRIQPYREPLVAIPVPTDWRAAALAEYNGILAELQRVTDLRERAARLRQGLLALGLVNVPELPGGQTKLSGGVGRSPHPWTPEADAELLRLAAEGKSCQEIARATGRTASAIQTRRTVLKKVGRLAEVSS